MAFNIAATTFIGNLTGNVTGNTSGTAATFTGNLTGDVTSSGMATTLATVIVAKGGTGLTTLTANNLIIGAGTSNVTFIAPSTSGNILQSNGTVWASVAFPGATGTGTSGNLTKWTSTTAIGNSVWTETSTGILAGSVNVPVTNGSVSRVFELTIAAGTSGTTRTVVGNNISMTGANSNSMNTRGYNVSNTTSSPLVQTNYDEAGHFGCFVKGSNNNGTTGSGFTGYNAIVESANIQTGIQVAVGWDNASSTTPKAYGVIATVTNNSAILTKTIYNAGFFKVGSARDSAFFDSKPSINCALIGDNGGSTASIIAGFDNGTEVWTLADGADVTQTGELKINTAGKALSIKEGSNARMGQSTLVGGTVTVSTTAVTASSRIVLTVNGGTLTNVGAVYVSARTANTSFVITSLNILDTSNVAWILIEPL